MKQLVNYILLGVFIGICSEIDTAFGNNISVDAVCVLSSFMVINFTTYCIYQIGGYAYRVLLSKEKSCLTVSLSVSFALGLFLILFRGKIVNIYDLTDSQYALFEKCLFVHGFSLPALALGEFIHNYMVLKCLNKQIWVCNFTFYGLMLLLDWLVVINNGDLHHLLVMTFISYVIFDTMSIKMSGVLKEGGEITFTDVRLCLRHGLNMIFDRLLGKVATFVFTIYASKLGTEAYSIHSVCYSIGVFTEYITNATFNYMIVVLAPFEDLKTKFIQCRKTGRRMFIPVSILGYVLSFIMLVIIHGKVTIGVCIIPMILYSSQCILIQLYENMRGFLTSAKRTDIIKWAGLIGIFVRIPVTLISYYTGIGIYGFAVASGIDYLFRGIYFYISSRYIIRKA